ncbi:MAG: DUF2993 domain-containing protein [Pegethrix bostrychoides GSE-TBD4-15B]|jgi:hypothetical protein|uniref:DUF2993 domain-containing protein n=1 Tax=Pegethrix bostrychoides GSE-TBD4-15B TaxID=2839662 RepID=A0A951PAX3_9CYAN|nr:DUF2993 domain-containing protein [Pegethrix bostrychoides GSE-TBD4-15B]
MTQPNLGEQALNKAAEVAIDSQLDAVDDLKVKLKSNPAKLVQGKVDQIEVTGTGMVMQQDLRVETAEITASDVAINPLKAIWSELELTQPANAAAELRLTEADLNRALASEFLSRKMQQLQISINGGSSQVSIQKAQLRLPDDQIELEVALKQMPENEFKAFSAVAKPSLKDNGQRIDLEILSATGQGLSLDFATELFSQIVELLDLRNFELEGIVLQLQNLQVQDNCLLLQSAATISKIPDLQS